MALGPGGKGERGRRGRRGRRGGERGEDRGGCVRTIRRAAHARVVHVHNRATHDGAKRIPCGVGHHPNARECRLGALLVTVLHGGEEEGEGADDDDRVGEAPQRGGGDHDGGAIEHARGELRDVGDVQRAEDGEDGGDGEEGDAEEELEPFDVDDEAVDEAPEGKAGEHVGEAADEEGRADLDAGETERGDAESDREGGLRRAVGAGAEHDGHGGQKGGAVEKPAAPLHPCSAVVHANHGEGARASRVVVRVRVEITVAAELGITTRVPAVSTTVSTTASTTASTIVTVSTLFPATLFPAAVSRFPPEGHAAGPEGHDADRGQRRHGGEGGEERPERVNMGEQVHRGVHRAAQERAQHRPRAPRDLGGGDEPALLVLARDREKEAVRAGLRGGAEHAVEEAEADQGGHQGGRVGGGDHEGGRAEGESEDRHGDEARDHRRPLGEVGRDRGAQKGTGDHGAEGEGGEDDALLERRVAHARGARREERRHQRHDHPLREVGREAAEHRGPLAARPRGVPRGAGGGRSGRSGSGGGSRAAARGGR